jgi:hypothetical protein
VVEEVVEIEQSGLPFVVRIEVPEPVEFAHEPCERGSGDIGRESRVSVAAALVDHLCRCRELFAAGSAEAGSGRG